VRKGECNHTEMYSALRALVPKRDDARTHFNRELHRELTSALGPARRLLVCGQALGRCVRHTVVDLVTALSSERASEQLRAITILRDSTSPVARYEPQGDDFVTAMRALGVTIADVGSFEREKIAMLRPNGPIV
jgi:nicotinamidase/pyrazinamidase